MIRYTLTWTLKNGEERTRNYSTKKEMIEALDIIKSNTDTVECYYISRNQEGRTYVIRNDENVAENKETKKTSDSQRRATEKYLTKFEEIKIRVPRGDKEKIKTVAENHNLSVNEFIKWAVDFAIRMWG